MTGRLPSETLVGDLAREGTDQSLEAGQTHDDGSRTGLRTVVRIGAWDPRVVPGLDPGLFSSSSVLPCAA